MSGDNTNARLLEYCDVFIAPTGTAGPATITDAFPVAWLNVGFIADDNLELARDWGKDEQYFDVNGVLVAQLKGEYAETLQFGFLEDNAATRTVIWPGSTSTSLKIPRSTPIMLGLDLHYQTGDHERLWTSNYALIDVEGWTWGGELTKFPATATIFPNASVAPAEYWKRQFEAA